MEKNEIDKIISITFVVKDDHHHGGLLGLSESGTLYRFSGTAHRGDWVKVTESPSKNLGEPDKNVSTTRGSTLQPTSDNPFETRHIDDSHETPIPTHNPFPASNTPANPPQAD